MLQSVGMTEMWIHHHRAPLPSVLTYWCMYERRETITLIQHQWASHQVSTCIAIAISTVAIIVTIIVLQCATG